MRIYHINYLCQMYQNQVMLSSWIYSTRFKKKLSQRIPYILFIKKVLIFLLVVKKSSKEFNQKIWSNPPKFGALIVSKL